MGRRARMCLAAFREAGGRGWWPLVLHQCASAASAQCNAQCSCCTRSTGCARCGRHWCWCWCWCSAVQVLVLAATGAGAGRGRRIQPTEPSWSSWFLPFLPFLPCQVNTSPVAQSFSPLPPSRRQRNLAPPSRACARCPRTPSKPTPAPWPSRLCCNAPALPPTLASIHRSLHALARCRVLQRVCPPLSKSTGLRPCQHTNAATASCSPQQRPSSGLVAPLPFPASPSPLLPTGHAAPFPL